jgi:hypothetical protein
MDDASGAPTPEEGAVPTFSPAQPMAFGPDADATEAGPGPGEWDVPPRRLFDARDEDPPTRPPDSFDPDGPDEPLSTTFAVSEVPHQTPLWPPATTPAPEAPEPAGEHGWIVATAVLVAVVIAVVVGFAVLWAPRDDGVQPSVSDPGPGSSTTAPTTTASASPPSSVPAATAVPAAAWAPFVAPDGAFRADMPGVPDAGTFPGLAGASSYIVDAGGVLFGVVAAPFAPTDPAAVQAGLAEAAASVLPAGSPAPSGTPVTFPGGISVLDFRQEVGDKTIVGRAEVANGRRFVLTMSVPTARVDDPAVTSDLVHFRNGFSATV